MNGYSHYIPHAAPGHSFDLVGYLVVSPSLVRARETRVLNLASEQNGWETPPRDKEWRRWLGAPGDFHAAIAQLLAALRTRTTVDGIWVARTLNQDLVLPFIPNVLTRSLWGRNVRQVGRVQVIERGGGATVAGVDDGTTRRFRDARSPEPLYQLTYRGRNI
ncbi:hypothetical protein T492DRAFT_1036885 [Pavlovales sp. CCMP2436]|nr:hypothetical protein T492DRAFT_1036885 [Pavlovales sp. CCMP2436]